MIHAHGDLRLEVLSCIEMMISTFKKCITRARYIRTQAPLYALLA